MAKRKLKAKCSLQKKQKLIKKGITSSLQEVSGARSERSKNRKRKGASRQQYTWERVTPQP
jgi:hypothetical protein